MAMAHLKIDNERKFKFEINDELLLFTVTKIGSNLNDECGLTAAVVEGVDKKGKITNVSVVSHESKKQLFSNDNKKNQILVPVDKLDIKFEQWFACTTSGVKGKTLPLYRVVNSPSCLLIKNVLRPVGRM